MIDASIGCRAAQECRCLALICPKLWTPPTIPANSLPLVCLSKSWWESFQTQSHRSRSYYSYLTQPKHHSLPCSLLINFACVLMMWWCLGWLCLSIWDAADFWQALGSPWTDKGFAVASWSSPVKVSTICLTRLWSLQTQFLSVLFKHLQQPQTEVKALAVHSALLDDC